MSADSQASHAPRLPQAHFATAATPFEPLPQTAAQDPAKVALGKRLFDEPLVSGSGSRACSDCHDLGAGGVVPGESRSNHPMTETGPYNVPTVFNVAYNFRYNWQGKFDTLEAHLGGPMMSAAVMDAGSWPALEERLQPAYGADFRAAGYPDGADEHAIRAVLAAFQRSLVTPNSRFDQHLRGELDLTDDEARGYGLFRDLGCVSCHQGINLGGNMFQRFGVMADAFDRPLVELDYGRMLVTGDEADAHVFRVPSLRNVAVTGPYFHDGSAPTLTEAVQTMARVQLGYALEPGETDDLVAFLNTLTGTWEGQVLASDVSP